MLVRSRLCKENLSLDPKILQIFRLIFLKFEILSDISRSHAIFGVIFGKKRWYFRQNGNMQLGACPLTVGGVV